MKKLQLALIAIATVLGVGGAIASGKAHRHQAVLYKYLEDTPQPITVNPVHDQDPTHYQVITKSYFCDDRIDPYNFCTYTLNNGIFYGYESGLYQE